MTTQSGPRTVVVKRDGNYRFSNGTAMSFVDPTTTLVHPGGVIVSQSPPESQNPTANGSVTLTFDRNLPTLAANMSMVFNSAPWQGQGSSIEDNVIMDTYGGRGVWLAGTRDVTVERNIIRYTSMAAIALMQETDESGDPGDVGGPNQSITISDNVIEGSQSPAACGTGEQNCLAAIEVHALDDQYFGFAPSGDNSGITIQRNYIADSGRSGVWLGEVAGALLENNLIIRSNRKPTLGGTYGISPTFASIVTHDATVPVAIRYSSEITQSGNVVEASSSIESPVTVPSQVVVSSAAGAHSFSIRTAISDFIWIASSDAVWLLTSATGSGNGSLLFSVEANTTRSSRLGHLSIAGTLVTVTQEAP